MNKSAKRMLPRVKKLYSDNPANGREEFWEILSGSSFRLEHIKSFGDASEDDSWYDQDQKEWVALINGEAVLEFEEGTLDLVSGDSLIIEAHQKHRVLSTSLDAVWIALHFD
jgi:cupin 2 domain-containing protein